MDTVAPRRDKMTSASTTLMWNFLYGFTIQRTARQSKMSRQWMNYQEARLRRKIKENGEFHCALPVITN